MGAAEVIYGYGESDALILTPHLGRIALKDTMSSKDIQEEGFGENAVDAVATGRLVEVSIPMTRSTLEQLELVLHGTLQSTVLKVTAFVGCQMYEDSRAMLIKPLCDNIASLDPAEWIEVFHTYPLPAIDLGYARDEQRVFLVNFKVFVSQESGHVGEIYQIGV
jgi:hypothetical protein